MSTSKPIRISDERTLVFRAPIAQPVRTSFGTMHDHLALLVRVEDDAGAFGVIQPDFGKWGSATGCLEAWRPILPASSLIGSSKPCA